VTRPKILHVKGSGGFGGDCVLMLELGRAAKDQGFDVDILAVDPLFQELIREEGLGLVDLDVIRREIRPLWDFRGLTRLAAFLAKSPYSIVHTHTSKPGIFGTLAARRAGIPGVIHTVHLFPFHEETGKVVTAAYVAAQRLAARWCDRIVTVSDYQRDWALRQGIGRPEQIVSIPNGVPVERARPARSKEQIRAEIGIGDAFMVLSTGRLAEQKGLEYLIRAAASVRSELPGIKIVLAGAGPLERKLAKLVSDLGLGDTVLLLGFRADVGSLLAACDLVVLPSLWEGLSISLLEAMAAGKPVVTTTLGSNLEVTADGKTAVLVPPKDPASLADAIRALALDPAQLEELGRRGLEMQRERYTMRRMVDAYSEEYEQLLSQKALRSPPRGVPVEGTS